MQANKLINYLERLLNERTSPSKGFDCSGFVQYVYKKCLGINISRTTKEQINDGFEVKKEDLLPGDLVFTSINHVSIYVGTNKILHMRDDNKIEKCKLNHFYKGRRIIIYQLWDLMFNFNTPLEQTEDNSKYLLGDYNKNGILDLYCIKKNNTLTNSTEVHILDGNNNYQSFLLQT